MASRNAGIVKLGTNHYKIRVRAMCPRTAQRKELRREYHCSLTEARAHQHALLDELIGSLEDVRSDKERLKDFAPSWLLGRKGLIKATTARKIAMVWDEHIGSSRIAQLYIEEIRSADVEAWLTELRGKKFIKGKGPLAKRKIRSEKSEPRPLSQGTIKGYYRVLSQILKVATARAGVRNPCEGVERVKPGRRKPNFLAREEFGGVLAHVQANAPEWYAAVLLDVFSGLRWGELSALRWGDIDEVEGVIKVRRNNDKGTVVDSTKTGQDEDAPKIVPLLKPVADVLRARRMAMVAAQHPGLVDGWIFPTLKGTLHKGTPLRDVLDAACAACGTKRRITTHGLRHTANDLLRRVADGDVVRAIIGHSTEQMTHHYSHVDETEKRAAAMRAFDGVLGPKGVTKGVAPSMNAELSKAPNVENPAVTRGSVGGATQI